MEIPLLREVMIIFSLSIAVILACHRMKIPPIVGFLLTGVFIGPHGLGFIKAVNDVDILATIGIVLLLFTVGMEFSLKKILEYRRYFLIGGTFQVAITVLAGFLIGTLIGRPWGESLFLGFLISLSSTAITLRVLDEKSESETPHGRLAVGILIFQDIVAIPMMLVTPFLGIGGTTIGPNFISTAVIGVFVLAIALFAATKIVPKILYQIAKTRRRELFLLTVLTICFSVAWLTSSIGLSLSLGAFLAGLIISESEYRHEAISDILPFQDVFTSFFFVSIGMLLDIGFVLSQPFMILLMTAAILLLKTGIAGISAIILGMPLRTAILTGLSLSQIGEFSFVLAKNGADYGLTDEYHYQLFLAISLLTMGLTPSLIASSGKIAKLILRLPFPEKLKTGLSPRLDEAKAKLKNHIIIIGYGLSGKNLALSAKQAGIPYIILEMNPETVKLEKEKGEPIHFGDATHEVVLRHADIENATVAAIVINDFNASSRIVEVLKRLNPNIYVIIRTHYFKQIHPLYDLGANDVIPDELGSSVEIFTKVLNLYQIPGDHIEKIAHDIRTTSYSNLKLIYKHGATLYDLKFGMPSLKIESFFVSDKCDFLERTLEELQLRANFGVTIVAIKRNNVTITSIDAKTEIKANDVLTVTGDTVSLEKMATMFH